MTPLNDDEYALMIAARVARKRALGEEAQQEVEKRLLEVQPQASVPSDPALLIPDSIEPVIGWRAWGIPADLAVGKEPTLHSVSHSHTWLPRQVQTATCHRGCSDVPSEEHSCGNYSAKTYEHLISMSYHFYDAERQGMFHVIGEVANWGKVIEGSQGWRSRHSYPKTLFIPFEAWHLAEPLRESWGVTVRLKNFLKSVDDE